MKALLSRRPRLALSFTILTECDTVRLVAGEDVRYTFTATGLDRWLPGLLSQLDGKTPLAEVTGRLEPSMREQAMQLVERLLGERVLTDGTAAEAHHAQCCHLAIEGSGELARVLAESNRDSDSLERQQLHVLCQDRLDYAAAEDFNRVRKDGNAPWIWATYGPMNRGYVSPVFLPDAGPCLACLLLHFQRLSPAPEIYDSLRHWARQGKDIVPVPFPSEAIAILKQLVLWKRRLLAEPVAVAALYRLHVLEVASMEVSSHRVFRDPECPGCAGESYNRPS